MAGRHEPPSKRSFWISLTTSVVKWLVVGAAVVVGVLVLARAFDSTVSSPVTPGASSPASTGAAPDTGGRSPKPTEPEPTTDFSGTLVGICNGTTTPGLASKAQKPLQAAGFTIDQLCNTTEDIATTTVYFVKAKDAAAAQAVADTEFPAADVSEYPRGQAVVDAATGETGPPAKGIQVVVFLGADYAA